jgi:hypothetical protein
MLQPEAEPERHGIGQPLRAQPGRVTIAEPGERGLFLAFTEAGEKPVELQPRVADCMTHATEEQNTD